MDEFLRLPLPAAPKVTIAVPTLDNELTIGDLLLQLTNMAPTGAEILVIDAGSRDNTVGIANSFAHKGVRVISTQTRRLGAAINLAAQQADPASQILIRCDPEQIYPHNFIGRLIETMRSTNADSVVLAISAHGRTPMERAIAWASNSFIGNGGSLHRKDVPSGYVDHGFHAAFRLETFRKLGGYDPKLARGEDIEYDGRVREIGGKIYLESAIPLTYVPANTLSDLWAQYHDEGMARAQTIRNRPGTMRIRHILVPANLIAQITALGLAFEHRAALLVPIAYCFTVGLFACITTELRKDWSGLLCIPAILTMHIAWGTGFVRQLILGMFQRRYRGRPLTSSGPSTENALSERPALQ